MSYQHGAVGIYRDSGRRAGSSDTDEAGAGVGGRLDRAPWLSLHNGALQFRSALQGSGTLVKLQTLGANSGLFHGGPRGVIGNTPSAGSYRRLMRALSEVQWDSLNPENIYCGNLTYAGVPVDGREVRRAVKAFERRLDRKLGRRGVTWGLFWTKEFQKRGAWHLHFLMYLPYGVPGVDCPGTLYDIIRTAWLAVIHQEDNMSAWLHGVECSRVQNIRAVKFYECKYMNKKARAGAKAYEKVQPEWFKGGGRWWGVVGRKVFPVEYRSILLHTFAEFVQVRRLLRSYMRHVTHGHYVPKVWGNHSMTVCAHGGDQCFLGDMIRWLSRTDQGAYPSALGASLSSG